MDFAKNSDKGHGHFLKSPVDIGDPPIKGPRTENDVGADLGVKEMGVGGGVVCVVGGGGGGFVRFDMQLGTFWYWHLLIGGLQ